MGSIFCQSVIILFIRNKLVDLYNKKITKKDWLNVILIVITLLYIGYIFASQGRQLLEAHLQYNFKYTIYAFVAVLPGALISVCAWRIILALFQVKGKYWDDVKIYFKSMISSILPGGVWGIVSRTKMYMNTGSKALNIASASIIENIFIGLAGLILYSVISLAYPTYGLLKKPEFGVILVVIGLVFIQPPIFNRLINWILRVFNKNKDPIIIGITSKDILSALGMELIVCIIGGYSIFLLLNSFYTLDLLVLPAIISAWAISTAFGNLLLGLPGKIIARDGILVLALANLMNLPLALISVLLIRIWSILSMLLNAILVTPFGDKLPKERLIQSGKVK